MSTNQKTTERSANQEKVRYASGRIIDWDKQKEKSLNRRKLFGTVLLFLVFIMFTFALDVIPLSFDFRARVIEAWQFKLIVVTLFLLMFFRIWTLDYFSESTSFVELDLRNRIEKSRYWRAEVEDSVEKVNNVTSFKSAEQKKSRKVVSGFEFGEHMRSIIESLDFQIDYAEEKASRLLEVGRSFVRGGITLYVLNIVVWQGYLFYIDFKINAGIIVGMASTTVIFLIMEFIGAWYLKQYRHYGDSAFSYMKVRSSYNKYMLSYCAILEFTGDDLSKGREELLRVLAESERWPELKDVNSNDFNYMIQSVESMGAIFDKLKGMFGHDNGSGNRL